MRILFMEIDLHLGMENFLGKNWNVLTPFIRTYTVKNKFDSDM